MYKNHASPLARVVQGIPASWEPAVSTATFDNSVYDVVWSPCNRFIAVAKHVSVEVLDAVTLARLFIFKDPPHYANSGQLSFSPDGRRLTLCSCWALIISWDLQTGSPLGTTPLLQPEHPGDRPFSFTHSKDGKVIAVAYKPECYYHVVYSSFICTYDHHSGRPAGSHRFPEGQIMHPMWTYDEYLRFATLNLKSIKIWQSPFSLEPPPVEIASFPVPDGITDAKRLLFLPTPPRLAFVLGDIIQVWDLKAPKLLLKSELTPRSDKNSPPQSSFSSDGRFFAYTTKDEGVHVWKESATGYLPHQRLPFFVNNTSVAPQLSPNTESIIVPLNTKIHRLHTSDQVLSLPSVSTGDRRFNDFTLGFSPDGNFAVFARKKENTVTIIDLKSGEPKWNTEVGLEIDCVSMTGGTVVAVGEESIVTWNSTNGIVRTTTLNYSSPSNCSSPSDCSSSSDLGTPYYMSISPDLSRVAVTRMTGRRRTLEVDDVSTGSCLAGVNTRVLLRPHFTQDGHEIWTGLFADGWGEECEIIEDSESGAIELDLQDNFSPDSEVFRESSSGYTVTDDWWVLSPSQKRLLWLPHHWRSDESRREWGGRFLGLLGCELSEVVILEFLE